MKKFFIYLGYITLICSSPMLICSDLRNKTNKLSLNVGNSGSSSSSASSAADAASSAGFFDDAYAMAENAWKNVTYPFKATWNAGNNAVQWVQENPGKATALVGTAAITGWYLHKKFKNFFTPIQSVAGIVHDARQVNWYQITLVNMQNPVAHIPFAQSNNLINLYTQVTAWALQQCQGQHGPQRFKVIVYVDIKGLIGRRSLGERILSVYPPAQPGGNAHFHEFLNFFTLNVAASHQNLETMPVDFQRSVVKASASLKNLDSSFSRETHLSDPLGERLNNKVTTFFANNIQPGVTKKFELRFSYKDTAGNLFHIQPFIIILDGTTLLTDVGYNAAFGYPIAAAAGAAPQNAWQDARDWFYNIQARHDQKIHFRGCQQAAATRVWQQQCLPHLG